MRILMSVSKLAHCKLHCIVLLSVFVTLYIIGSLSWILTQNYLSEETFLETNKCPVCYGTSMCDKLLHNDINLVGLSRFRSFDVFNSKNTHFAVHGQENTNYVIKKLASDRQLVELDEKLCFDAGMGAHCDVALAAPKLSVIKDSRDDTLFAKHLQGTSPMFVCPSTRLLSNVYQNYVEKKNRKKVTMRDKLQILTTSMVNSEPLILQTFPSSDGWPFPDYHGACGRYVILGHGGRSLAEFYTASWNKRVDLTYQLLRLADLLTTNKQDFALYLSDVTYDNFAVDSAGKVRLVDLEDVVVVDKQAIKTAQPEGWKDIHESSFSECPGKTFKSCHSFSETQLCSHISSDHNFYAICHYILSRNADDSEQGQGRTNGLLHDMPDGAKNDWDLEYLLNECVLPKRKRGRIQVVHKLIEALDNLRQKSSSYS